MTKRAIDKNWKALLQSGAVTHNKKKKEQVNYEKKTKDGKKTIWFDVDKSILEQHDALMPSKGKASSLKNKIVAIDCEMVGIGFGGKKSVLARASVVSGDGEVLIDEFCRAPEKVTDYRTLVSGVRPKDLKDAQPFESLRKKVKEALAGKILVGHGLSNDLKCLKINHPASDIRDTANYFKNAKGSKQSLQTLASERLGIKIQTGEHSPIVDARAALRIYLQSRREWEEKLKKEKQPKKGKIDKVEEHESGVVDEEETEKSV
ncbi:Oidioi.mRNA.OKI2018_I69.chrUn_2.g17223.t1.cds [Oikopleura dioica]|uniref:RNA exonuclease 4 n=1 Tax=Oikopleura dioica TaxID=34765 RepID=A0ABN7TCE3_OIKDI|nr:Oidioi.mRNA.OKI2018_I69.chrUn_2.g17223.t1.cds [Oikopleura dioica]